MARRVTAERFIGRSDVLALFDDVLAAAHAGHGDVVLLNGDAGVGKSRTVGELLTRARQGGALALLGRCVEHGEEVMPLAPVADVLRDIAVQTTPNELAAVFGPDSGGPGRLLPDLSPAGGTRIDEPAFPLGRQFDGILVGLRGLSERRPVVVVVEDLHWADESTRQLLTFLAPRLMDQAVVLVMTYRSDDLHRRHPLRPFLVSLERAVRPERIEIAPFTPSELAELVKAVTQSRPDERFVTELHDRCGGNAFFAEELLARGQVNLPTALRDVIVGKIGNLTDVETRVLRAGAAAGPGINMTVLSAVCDLDILLVRVVVDALVDSAIWVHDGDGLRFRHELVREVIDDEMLGEERAALHASAARALEALTPERRGEIARHWVLAGDQPRAFEASIAAGRAAVALGADAEALPQFERALELWKQTPQATTRAGCSHRELFLEAADSAGRSRSFARATALGRRALDQAADDPTAEGLTCLRLIDWAWWNENEDDAARLIARAITLIPAEPPSEARALAVAWQGLLLAEQGETGARGLPAEALALARTCDAKRAEAHALITIGSGRCYEGASGGLDELKEGLALALSQGYALEAGRAYHNLAVCLEQFSRHAEVIAMEQAAIDFCAAMGIYRVHGVMVERIVIRSLQRLGLWSTAEARVDRLRNEFGDLRLEHFSVAGSWGLILVRQGRLTGLASVISDALARMPNHPFIFGAAATTAVEFAAAESRVTDIPELVESTLDHLLPGDTRDAAELVASAIGILADWSNHMKARSRQRSVPVHHRCETWMERVERACAQNVSIGAYPDLAPRLAHARAEFARLRADKRCQQQWTPLIDAWDALDAPYETAYSRLRLADAILNEDGGRSVEARTEARSLLTAARRSAAAMGATPLIDAIDRRAHLNLATRQSTYRPTRTTGPAATLGLTERELEVLHLVAAGHSNGQIGQVLYISRKTASVHISNILRKLGVSSRIEAAAIAASETRYGTERAQATDPNLMPFGETGAVPQ